MMNTNERPNLIFVMPDQLRADFLPAYGCTGIETPNIDALVAQSTLYEQAYSLCPLCVPARAALLSGLRPLRSGVVSNHQWLRPDRSEMGMKTWPDQLRDVGYRTAAIGKMHFHPFEAEEGFDERIISEDKRWTKVHDDYAEFLAKHGLQKFDATQHPDYAATMGTVPFPHDVEFTPDRFVANAAADFIRRQPEGRPFAMMVGFPSPHCPYDALPQYSDQIDGRKLPALKPMPDHPAEFWQSFNARFIENHKRPWHALDYSAFSEEARQRVRVQYAGLIRQIDDEVGRIIEICKKRGIWENTLFVFTSDHGDHVGDRSMVGKGDFFEESIRIPMIVKRPGPTHAARSRTIVELQQVPPTLMQVGGAQIPNYWNYPPLPSEESSDGSDAYNYGVLVDCCMVRRGPWKLTDYADGELSHLVNLDEDPAEVHNRFDDRACQEIRFELGDALRRWLHTDAVRGHDEKYLQRSGGLAGSAAFGRRGWQRTYPLPVFDANGDGE